MNIQLKDSKKTTKEEKGKRKKILQEYNHLEVLKRIMWFVHVVHVSVFGWCLPWSFVYHHEDDT